MSSNASEWSPLFAPPLKILRSYSVRLGPFAIVNPSTFSSISFLLLSSGNYQPPSLPCPFTYDLFNTSTFRFQFSLVSSLVTSSFLLLLDQSPTMDPFLVSLNYLCWFSRPPTCSLLTLLIRLPFLYTLILRSAPPSYLFSLHSALPYMLLPMQHFSFAMKHVTASRYYDKHVRSLTATTPIVYFIQGLV